MSSGLTHTASRALSLLVREWRRFTSVGLAGVSTGLIAAFSPIAKFANEQLGVASPKGEILSGAIVAIVVFGLLAILGTAKGRRFSVQYIIDDTGSAYVIAEFRGLKHNTLPIRLGIPETHDTSVYLEPILAAASHGRGVQFVRDTGKKGYHLPKQIRDVWSGEVHFSGPPRDSFDFTLVYLVHHVCALDLTTHQIRWATQDTFDDLNVVARADWDELELRKYWKVQPLLESHPVVTVFTEQGAVMKERALDWQSNGAWGTSTFGLKKGQRVQLRWSFVVPPTPPPPPTPPGPGTP